MPEPRPIGDDAAQARDFVMRLADCQLRLRAFIRTLVPHPADTDDVLQSTNAVLWEKQREYDPGRPFITWACGIAHNVALATLRRQRRSGLTNADETVLARVAAFATREAEHADGRIDALRRCLGRLTERQRQLLRARYEHGRSVKAMAAELQQAPDTVSAVLYRLRRALHTCIRGILQGEAT